MTRAFVAEVEVDGIAGEKPAHEGGQPGAAWAKQQMNVGSCLNSGEWNVEFHHVLKWRLMGCFMRHDTYTYGY
jgi:hypothetical protein